jgi:hypothetical protein
MSHDNIVERLRQLRENVLRLYGQTVELAQQAERAARLRNRRIVARQTVDSLNNRGLSV